jgi:3-deoxy-D-arabino-heptulosonate 7-phosphate (DAHP) synthase
MVRPTSATAREAPEGTAGSAEPAVVLAGGVAIGSDTFTLIARTPGGRAGVAAVEEAAALALRARAGLLDIGRDWEPLGLELVAACQRAGGLPLVCGVSQPGEVAALAAVAGMLRVPAAALDSRPLARALGRSGCPVLLEGDPAGVRSWLRAAERIVAEGNDQVVLCAAGGWAPPAGAAWLDLAAVPSLRVASGLPLVIDASRAQRGHHNAAALARAAAAVCADGVVVGVDPRPGPAGGQPQPAGLAADELDGLASELEAVAAAVGRRMAGRRIRYVGAGRRDSAAPARRWRRP